MFLRLRPADWGDADELLEWKNDPDVRRFSIVTHDKIKREDHYKWFSEHMDEILIIEDHEEKCGDIRVTDGEVAIKLAPNARGKGIGHIALFMVQKQHQELTARITHGNVASMRLFLGNGFEVVGLGDGYYVLQWRR